MKILLSLAGMALILAIAFLLSSDRRAIRPRVVGAAFALQHLDDLVRELVDVLRRQRLEQRQILEASHRSAAILGLAEGAKTSYTAPNGRDIAVEIVKVATYTGQ